MALRLAEALNWRGIPSCGFLRRAGKPFICSSEGEFKGKKAFECDLCSWKRSENIKRVYFGVPACLPGACFVAFTSAAPAASEQLVIPLPSTNIVPHRFRNKSSRESRPVFERANPSVHHDDAMQATTSRTYFFLCVCEFCLVAHSREYFRHTSSLHFFCSLAPTGESLNQHLSVVTKRKIKIR